MIELIYNVFFKITLDPWNFASIDQKHKYFYKHRNDVIYLDNEKMTRIADAEADDWSHPVSRCHCKECKSDNVRRLLMGTFDATDDVILHVLNWPEYFFITPLEDIMLSTKKFSSLIKKENFTGYRISKVPNDNVLVFSQDLSETEYTEKEEVYSIDFIGNFFNPYLNAKKFSVKCPKCQYDRIRCIAGAEAQRCPICGNTDLDYSEKYVTNTNADIIVQKSFVVDYYVKSGINTCIPVYANKWDGCDFMKDNYLVSGRVAKWIVENNIYPLCLIPYPCYVSDCNKEQRERIEDIRYHHPCAIPPIQ